MSEATEDTRRSMREAIARAQRHLERLALPQAHAERSDNFAACLVALRSVVLYFQPLLKRLGRGEDFERLLKAWQGSLTADERQVLKALREVRNENVHERPVATDPRGGLPLTNSGASIVLAGDRIPVIVRHVVEHDGREWECVNLCRRGVALMTRFAEGFDALL